MASAKLTAPEIIDQMVEEPTLDEFFDRDPNEVDLKALIKRSRADRAAFIKAGDEKKYGKETEDE